MASPVSHFQVLGKVEILNAHSEGKISKWHWCKIHICKLHMLFRYWQWVWQMKKVTNILTPSLPKHDTSWLWIGVFIVLLYFKDWSIANVLDRLHSLISTSEVSANCNSYFFKKNKIGSGFKFEQHRSDYWNSSKHFDLQPVLPSWNIAFPSNIITSWRIYE